MATLLQIEWIERIFQAEYPLIIRHWVFPLVIGLLSLSMPLLINSIIRIESSYPKNNFGKLILTECSIWWYFAFIVITIASIIVYILQIPRSIDFSSFTLNTLIDHSAEILVTFAAFGFLTTVLIVTRFILKYTINTHSLYQYYRGNIKKYFVEASTLQNKKNDVDLAKKYRMQQVLVIVEKAFEEQNHSLYNDIVRDFQDGVEIYRNQWIQKETNKRHSMVEYPLSLRNELFDLAQTCFSTNEINVQEQVFGLLQTIFIDTPPRYGDVPKTGLRFSSLETLWSILIDAINRQQSEFMKLYWRVIYGYAKEMFHAHAITKKDEDFLHDVQRYDLSDEDRYELAMISYMNFMLQAYLYYKKEYDTLKYILEFDDQYQSVPELNFLLIEEAIKAYKSHGLSYDDTSDINRRPNTTIINKYLTYSNYRTTSDWAIQQRIVDNYFVFIVTYCYNNREDVPVCSIDGIKFSRSDYNRIKEAFESLNVLPNIQINNITLNRILGLNEYTFFLNSLKPRNKQEEVMFISNTNCRHLHMNLLYGSIKGTLSYEIPLNIFVWTHKSDYINKNNSTNSIEEIVSSYLIDKKDLIYEGGLRKIPCLSFDIAQNHLRKIDVKVALSAYATQLTIEATIVSAEELCQTIGKLYELDRVLYFYTNTEDVEKLAQHINFSYENRRDYLSSNDWSSRKSIKCVRLPEDSPNAMKLKNQIWILAHDEQPVLNFYDVDDTTDYESIHKYGRAPIDRSEEWFAGIPFYIGQKEIENDTGGSMIQVYIKNKIEVISLNKMNAKIYRLDSMD